MNLSAQSSNLLYTINYAQYDVEVFRYLHFQDSTRYPAIYVCIYIVCYMRAHRIPVRTHLRVSKIKSNDFHCFMLQVSP